MAIAAAEVAEGALNYEKLLSQASTAASTAKMYANKVKNYTNQAHKIVNDYKQPLTDLASSVGQTYHSITGALGVGDPTKTILLPSSGSVAGVPKTPENSVSANNASALEAHSVSANNAFSPKVTQETHPVSTNTPNLTQNSSQYGEYDNTINDLSNGKIDDLTIQYQLSPINTDHLIMHFTKVSSTMWKIDVYTDSSNTIHSTVNVSKDRAVQIFREMVSKYPINTVPH